MKRSKGATSSSSSRPMPRNKQLPQPPKVMSNIENDLSFGNGVVGECNYYYNYLALSCCRYIVDLLFHLVVANNIYYIIIYIQSLNSTQQQQHDTIRQ